MLAQYLVRSTAVQRLSAVLICWKLGDNRGATDRDKPSQPQRFWVGIEPVPAGWTRCPPVLRGLQRASTGAHWRGQARHCAYGQAPPMGELASCQNVYKGSEIFVKNLWFRAVSAVIVQMSQLYSSQRYQKDDKSGFEGPHRTVFDG